MEIRENIHSASNMVSYRSFRSLITLCSTVPEILNRSTNQLLTLLSKIVILFQMKDIEIALWGIYLDRFAWVDYLSNPKALKYSAYTSLSFFQSESLEIIDLNSTDWIDYNDWAIKNMKIFQIDYYSLNRFYKVLYCSETESDSSCKKDYNQMVDILVENLYIEKNKKIKPEDKEYKAYL